MNLDVFSEWNSDNKLDRQQESITSFRISRCLQAQEIKTWLLRVGMLPLGGLLAKARG
jgi:hypothetical protein